MAIGSGRNYLCSVITPGVAGDHDLVVNHYARYRRHVIFAAVELDAQLDSHLAAFWLSHCQLAAHRNARCLDELLLANGHPERRASFLVAGMNGGGIEVSTPFAGLGVQLVQVGYRLEAQAGLELAFDDVSSVFHLTGNPCGAGLVDYRVDAQGVAQVVGHGRGVGRTGVHHQDRRHTM
ncbi:hypothetical protein D9M68_865590 [compost metagenome]